MSDGKIYGYGGMEPMSMEEMSEEYRLLGVIPKSGISPHERPGHRTPDPLTEKQRQAISASRVIHQPSGAPGEDEA